MILKALTLENFKGIREPVRIEFAPLTLLFGPNNAGKSTIMQALMYAREVLERNNCDAGHTKLGGAIVDLGGFANIVYGRDLNRVIRMRFELDLSDKKFPSYTGGWIEEWELDHRIEDLGRGEEGFDVASAEKVTSRLNQVWVEIQISWDSERGAHVSEYCVGHGTSSYARISLSEEQDDGPRRALLSSFSYGTYPFGSTYHGGEETTSSLVSQARQFIKECLLRDGLVDGFREGARVAMEGEVVDPDDNRVPWETYNQLVEDWIAGRGEWGDSSVDPDTGEQNFYYKLRQSWLAVARPKTPEEIHRAREKLRVIFRDLDLKSGSLQSKTDEAVKQPGSSQEQSGEASTALGLNGSTAASTVIHDDRGDAGDVSFEDDGGAGEGTVDADEFESWFWDLLMILVKWEYIPVGSTHPLRLGQLDTALPEWGRRIDFDPRIWEVAETSGGDWETLLVFGQEYLRGLLTTIIVGPGERLKEALEQSVYLSPFREVTQRDFVAAHSLDTRRWCNGLAAWDRLILDGEPLARRVNTWLNGDQGLNSGYWIEVKRYKELDIDGELFQSLASVTAVGDLKPLLEQVSGLPDMPRLRIVGRDGTRFSPQDLGVGVSQVVPVIVAALYNTSGLVAIEEPESNIHPAFQVVLADLFITQAKANPDVMFLVETHSEHLMLRCLRRIRETNDQMGESDAPAATPEDIAVHFVEPSEQGPVIHRIRIDDDGEFMDPWPRGFFPERMKEVYDDVL